MGERLTEATRVVQRASNNVSCATRQAPQESTQEGLYDDAWDALREHNYKKAADGFARAWNDSPTGPLADEATFWHATALARGGDSTAAISVFRQMLDAYPRSPRRGEASAILAWLLVAAHQLTEAEGHFRAALDDTHEGVRASAREGLKNLASEQRDRRLRQ
jgi:TolA-binding protein